MCTNKHFQNRLVSAAFWGEAGRLALPLLLYLLFTQEIKQVNVGAPMEDMNQSIVLYADDTPFLAKKESSFAKSMLSILSSGCS